MLRAQLLIGLLLLLAAVALAWPWVRTETSDAPPPAQPVADGAISEEHYPPLGQGEWSSVGGPGFYAGGFHHPRGVIGLPDGRIVAVDRAARFNVFSPKGRPLKMWAMRPNGYGISPKGLCRLPNGDLLIADTHFGRVVVIDLDGREKAVWGSYGTGPGQFVHPLSCIVDEPSQRAFIVQYGDRSDRVQVFSLDGQFLYQWGAFGEEPGNFRRPSGITLDPEGYLWVADMANHRLQKFKQDGTFVLETGGLGSGEGQLRYPQDVAASSDGLLYVAEFDNDRISVFRTDGSFVRHLGRPGRGVGQFNSPWSLTVDPWGRLIVSDTNNSRLQVLQVAPKR